jgi:drug/metabolite transporter (DMT)-like permease
VTPADLVLLTANAVFRPLVGALLGVAWPGEPATAFPGAGGAMILGGLRLALTGRVRTG